MHVPVSHHQRMRPSRCRMDLHLRRRPIRPPELRQRILRIRSLLRAHHRRHSRRDSRLPFQRLALRRPRRLRHEADLLRRSQPVQQSQPPPRPEQMVIRRLARPFVLHVDPAPLPHLPPPLRFPVQLMDRRRQRLHREVLRQHARHAFHHRLLHPGRPHAHHRRPARNRLDEHLPERLLPARPHIDVRRRVVTRDRLHALHMADPPDVQSRRQPLVPVPLLPQAHHRHIRQPQAHQRLQRQPRVLPCIVQVPAQHHQETVFRQPQPRPAGPSVQRPEYVQRKAQPEPCHRPRRLRPARCPHRLPRKFARPLRIPQQRQLILAE